MTIKNQTFAWLQLFRLPNLFTIPGEAIVGGLLVGISLKTVTAAGFVFLLIYIGGLIVNDIADYEEDRRERSWRPLPSGRISKSSATTVAFICYVSSLVFSFLIDGSSEFFAVTVLIIILTLIYNLAARKIPPLGWTTVASCRALIPVSFFLISDKTVLTPLIYSAGIFLYIWIISAAAHNETRRAPSFPIHIILPLTVFFCLSTLNIYSGISIYALLWSLPAVFISLYFSFRIKKSKEPEKIQMYIGKSIGAVLFFQGAALLVVGNLEGIMLWALYPFSSFTAKTFKGS